MAFNKVQVGRFFYLLKELLQRHNFTADRIFNADESCTSTVHSSLTKVINPTGRKQVGHLTSAERGKTVTIVCACSPSGIYIPPMLIFARKRSHSEIMEGTPHGTVGVVQDKEWMTKKTLCHLFRVLG